MSIDNRKLAVVRELSITETAQVSGAAFPPSLYNYNPGQPTPPVTPPPPKYPG